MDLKEIFAQLKIHLLGDVRPSYFINDLSSNPLFMQYPFGLLNDLKKTEQSPVYHPEGSVWNHTMLVVDEAAAVKTKSANPQAFMWAALLHDIGKPATTKLRKGKITSYEHDKEGAKLAKQFLCFFGEDDLLIDEVRYLIRYHMQILYVVNGMRFADIAGMKMNSDIKEIALLGLCDRLGRTGSDRLAEEETINIFKTKCGLN